MIIEEPDLVAFKVFLSLRGCKPSTVKRHLANILKVSGELYGLTNNDYDTYFASLISRGLKKSYCNSLLDTIRVFCHYKHIPIDYRKFKEDEFIKATMSDDEIEAFLAIEKPRNVSPRHWATWNLFFSIMAFTGMRPGEVAYLKVDDIDFGRSVFSIEEGKTGHRLVPIPKLLEKPLTDHLGGLQAQYLFASERGGNQHGLGAVFNSVDWGYNFHSRIKRLGIKRKNLSPYSLRHSLITRLLEEDVNLFKVQKIVGHRDMRTTAHYTHMTTKDIQVAIQKHPLIRRSSDPVVILQSLISALQSYNLETDARFEFSFHHDSKSLKFECCIIEGVPA